MLECTRIEALAPARSRGIRRLEPALPFPGLSYSNHARLRKSQRCKRDRLVEVLLQHFDRDVYLRRGRWAWSVSSERCVRLREAGVITAAEADRLPGLVIVNSDSGVVVTVVRGQGRRLGQYLSRH